MSEQKLKPCPFCGGEAKFGTYDVETNLRTASFRFELQCKKCKIPSITGTLDVYLFDNGDIAVYKDERKRAIDAWNRRANDEQTDC